MSRDDIDKLLDDLGFPPSTADADAEIVSAHVIATGDYFKPFASVWRRADGHTCITLANTRIDAINILARWPKGPPDGLWLPVDEP